MKKTKPKSRSKKAPSSPRAKKNAIEKLRRRAEKVLEQNIETGRLQKLSKEDVQSLAHELGVHQVELEMQNEELRKAQDELERSRRRYADLYEFAPAGYFTFNARGEILELNYIGAKLLGKDKTFLLNKSFLLFVPDRDQQDRFRMVLREVFMAGTAQVIDVKLRNADGNIFHGKLQLALPRQSSASSSSCMAVLIDITESKLSEQEREQLIADLTRSNKELEQFAYVSSHDLQEPLRTITSYVQLLQERYKGRLDEKADIYIQFAVEGAERMQNLIEGLLAYSRIIRRGAEFEPIDLNTVFSAAISSLSASIRETHADISKENLPQVMGDETQLMQLLQNLIGNAIKYRKPGIAPAIHISAERKGSEWIVSIQDNGIGIEPRFFERIFRIFQRLHTRDEYSGTGIGLALCKRIVERHHGRIWVESTPGRGSTFFFTIPI